MYVLFEDIRHKIHFLVKILELIYTSDHIPKHLIGGKSRIISCVPSLTEWIVDLGLENELIGVTKFCVHPPEIRRVKTIIGGTKNLRIGQIQALNPDLIITNKEENSREEIELLSKNFSVYLTRISNFDDAIFELSNLSMISGKEKRGQELLFQIEAAKAKAKKGAHSVSALYIIWQKPYMAAGGDTFIHAMMDEMGLLNIISHKKRYPEFTIDEIRKLNPDCILLSSEPFPFNNKHLEAWNEMLPNAKIYLVDGEMFSWYGSRMIQSFPYFEKLSMQIERW